MLSVLSSCHKNRLQQSFMNTTNNYGDTVELHTGDLNWERQEATGG